jgi:phosphoribosylanthranilate isomerase
MSLTVKICGLSTQDTLDAALAAGADMVGFVFCEKSPRHISFETARTLGARVAGRVPKVALTVDADDATLAAIIAELKPQLLQAHGKESPERVFDLRARFGLPVMKAILLSQKDDLAAIARYEPVADWLLFDAKPAANAARPGGNGETFDWGLLRGIEIGKPWLLAGGLNVDNLATALATGAPGVDISSGVETMPGVKDTAKIRAFIAEARRLTEPLGSRQQNG